MATRELILSALFTALIAVGAFLRIPLPVMPFTLQTLFVALAGLLLGARFGAVSAACYLALGLLGVPVFTEGGGIAYVLKPSFGYLVGFVLGAYVTGRIACAGAFTLRRLLAASFSGLAVIYAVGILYLAGLSAFLLHAPVSGKTLLFSCFLLVLPGDAVLMCAASAIALRIAPQLSRR